MNKGPINSMDGQKRKSEVGKTQWKTIRGRSKRKTLKVGRSIKSKSNKVTWLVEGYLKTKWAIRYSKTSLMGMEMAKVIYTDTRYRVKICQEGLLKKNIRKRKIKETSRDRAKIKRKVKRKPSRRRKCSNNKWMPASRSACLLSKLIYMVTACHIDYLSSDPLFYYSLCLIYLPTYIYK